MPPPSQDSQHTLALRGNGAPPADAPDFAGPYRLEGEIASGGMGVVYRARDQRLGRDLAVKILRADCAYDQGLHARFAFEARVTGQLQHPGIPPVHEVGSLPDGRPFLAMKLIHGRTLADLLKERPSPAEGLPYFLGIFEQVCQTVAYAHGQGVIHRDLKPDNIMVGAFGEVQVMDWGLAKRKADADVGPLGRSPEPASGLTGEGGVMGTPAYMAPEQRRGQADERSDVFSLGAILSDILAGNSAPGGSSGFRHMLAALGLAPGITLEKCTADPALVALARRCLDASPAERPADAAALAEEIRAYQEGVRARLREAELARVRAEEGGARRRLLAAFTVALLLVVVVLLHTRQQAAMARAEEAHRLASRENAARAALGEARRHSERARTLHDDPARSAAALDAAEASLRAAQEAGGLAPDLADEIAAEQRALADARADLRLFNDLAAARDARTRVDPTGTRFMTEAAVPLVVQALTRHGMAVGGPLDDAARHVLSRHPAVRAEAVDALGLCLGDHGIGPGNPWIMGLLGRIDDDPWRREALAAFERKDGPAIHALALRPESAAQPPSSVMLLSNGVPVDHAARLGFLREAARRHPTDFWLHQSLGQHLSRHLFRVREHREAVGEERVLAAEAAGHFQAALALRPDSTGSLFNLAVARRFLGEARAAEETFRRVVARDPHFVLAHVSLAEICVRRGDHAAAVEVLRRADDAAPRNAWVRASLGKVLIEAGRPHEGADSLRLALADHPGDPQMLSLLGRALDMLGEEGPALAYLWRAALAAPDNTPILIRLAEGLAGRGHPAAVERLLRRVLRLEADDATAQVGLAAAVSVQGRHAEALPLARAAVASSPGSAEAHYHLGLALEKTGDPAGARAAYERAVGLGDSRKALHGLVRLELKPRPERALELARRASDVAPKDPFAWMNLSLAFTALGRGREAHEAALRAVDLAPNLDRAHCLLGLSYMTRREARKALSCMTTACELAPASAQYRFHRGEALLSLRRPSAALDDFRHSITLGGFPDAHVAAAELLGARGEWAASECVARLGTRRHPDHAVCWRALSVALSKRGQHADALAAVEKAVALDPKDAVSHAVHGIALQWACRFDDAAAATRRALALMPEGSPQAAQAEHQLAVFLHMAALGRKLKAVLAGDSEEADASRLMEMATLCDKFHRLPADAARLAEQALAAAKGPAPSWRMNAAIYAVAAARADRPNAAAWRGKALAWLTRQAAEAPADARAAILAAWRSQPGLAPVRGDAIDALPEGERAAWRAFWAGVK